MKKEEKAERGTATEIERVGEAESFEDRLALMMTAQGSKPALEIRGKLMKDYLKNILSCNMEDGSSVMDAITKNWLTTMMHNGVTTKDMVQIQKMLGEDVQRSQSVSVKINAEAKAVKSTDDFLSGIGGEKKDG